MSVFYRMRKVVPYYKIMSALYISMTVLCDCEISLHYIKRKVAVTGIV